MYLLYGNQNHADLTEQTNPPVCDAGNVRNAYEQFSH